MNFVSMECNEVFSVSRSAMLGRKHGLNSSGEKEFDRMLWNSPPVASLQATVPVSVSNRQRRHSDDTRTNNATTAVRYRAHVPDDDMVPSSPVELCDAAVLKITDATTTSVGATPSSVQTTSATPPPTSPPAFVSTADAEDSRRRLRRWLDLCHCERHLVAIKVFYFTFIGALGVCFAYAVVFLKQLGLSPVSYTHLTLPTIYSV